MKYKDYIITDSISGLSRDQTELFTPQHKKFNLCITITKEGLIRKKHFKYQYNPKYSKFEKGDGILAVIYDALSYFSTQNLSCFLDDLGYDSNKESDLARGKKSFTGCKNAWDFLRSAGLDYEDLESIRDKIES